MVKTDFHTHCLPEMDDGAENAETSLAMIRMLQQQGIARIVLSSHFYPQNESIETFLSRRAESFGKLQTAAGRETLPSLLLSAEVNMTRRISQKDLSPLCIEGTSFIMLEMPYGKYEPWVIDEIENILYEQKLTPIMAHIDRYLAWFKPADFENIFSIYDVIYQINASAFASGKSKKFVLNLAECGYPLVVGTDAHNLSSRKPNLTAFYKTVKKKSARLLLRAAFRRSNKVLPFDC